MKHYDISYAGEAFDYKGSGFGTPNLPERGGGHVDKILDLYKAVIAKDEEALKKADVAQVRDGYYIMLRNTADYDFALKSIDSPTIGHIVSVQDTPTPEGGMVTSAILFLKKKQKDWLDKKVETYKGNKRTKNNERLNKPLLESIEEIRTVTVDDLWHGKGQMPAEVKEWVELWFAENTADPVLSLMHNLQIEYKERYLKFPERIVILACANKKDMERLFYASDTFVKVSSVPTLAGFIAEGDGPEQRDWLNMIMSQYCYDAITNRYLCILDSGVIAGHPMLLPVIADHERYSVLNKWGVNDKWPHGTMMAGVAAYGDLTDALANRRVEEPRFRLCSVKVANKQDGAEKQFWADFTKQGVSIAEINHGNDVMGYCMAVAEDRGWSDGTPSSWSSALDQICFGDEPGLKRLFVQCAGNVDEEFDWQNYPDANKTRAILNPGQAWNALTVGAYTEKVRALDSNGHPMNVIAREGSLSPYSTTSLLWMTNMPIKPEVVMEGGNRTMDVNGATYGHNDLELLTTSNEHTYFKYFRTFNATSAATALAARYAGFVAVENPSYWPETIRGLFVHTAKWTEQMEQDFPDKDERLRVCGYGVPDLEKMLESRKNGVTFIAQNSIQPYKKGKKEGQKKKGNSFNKMHIYELPWPKDTLLMMGEKTVKLSITLSYFIEPGPTDNYVSSFKKYNYASAGLRFELSNVNEKPRAFRHRIQRDYDEDDVKVVNDTQRWYIGIKKRTKGSIHKDWIEMSAADLATCNLIAVFPVSGWWYNRNSLDKIEAGMRYSLIVSLETEEQQIDFSSEIDVKIANAVSIEID
jgi:hypothetical protein